MKPAVLWIFCGVGAFAAAAIAYGCVVPDTCEDDDSCPKESARTDPDAAGTDSCADDAVCSSLADGSDTDGAFNGLASDSVNDSHDEACIPGDGAGALGPEANSGAASDGAGADAAAITADVIDANTAAPFLGVWTLTGTETSVCPNEPSVAGPTAGYMTFSPGPGPTDGGEVDLLFDAGADCSLALFVSAGVARLAFAPQPCTADADVRVFASVQVTLAAASLQISETFSDSMGCEHELQGILTN
jgi:hypothetical protein